jgi:hypothetical protein
MREGRRRPLLNSHCLRESINPGRPAGAAPTCGKPLTIFQKARQQVGGPTTLWSGRAATGNHTFRTQPPNGARFLALLFRRPGLRTESFVEFQEIPGLGDCRAVSQSACLPRSGASMAHPSVRCALCASVNKAKAFSGTPENSTGWKPIPRFLSQPPGFIATRGNLTTRGPPVSRCCGFAGRGRLA